MKRLTLACCALGLISLVAAAQEPKDMKGMPGMKGNEMSTEQRKRMADAHEKMAACLRTERPVPECHAEMRKICDTTMGTDHCQMMMGGGMGPMKHHLPAVTPAGAK